MEAACQEQVLLAVAVALLMPLIMTSLVRFHLPRKGGGLRMRLLLLRQAWGRLARTECYLGGRVSRLIPGRRLHAVLPVFTCVEVVVSLNPARGWCGLGSLRFAPPRRRRHWLVIWLAFAAKYAGH